MRKITLFLLAIVSFVLLTQQALAQFQSKNLFIGGQVGVSTLKQDTSYYASKSPRINGIMFKVYPTVGIFLTKNAAIGVRLGYGQTKTTYAQVEIKDIYKSAGLFFRYYKPLNESFQFYVEPSAFYSVSDSKVHVRSMLIPDATTKTTFKSFNFRPGFNFFPWKNWAFDFSLGALSYVMAKDEFVNEDGNPAMVKSNYFDFLFNTNSLSIGIQYFVK